MIPGMKLYGGSGVTPPVISTLTLDGNKSHAFTQDGEVLTLGMAGNHTLTLSDPPDVTKAYRVTVECVQDSTGGRVLTLAGNRSAPGTIAPVLSTGAAAVDLLEFLWTGAKWRFCNATYAHG